MKKYVTIKDEYITLGQLLKAVDLISSGGQAKYFLAENNVYVNGIPSGERGKKLRPGDQISFDGKVWIIGGGNSVSGKPED